MRKTVAANIARIVEGLRDTGYSFETAIADLVDNSIDAGATVVNITVDLDGQRQPIVQVADNGSGMDLPALENAMRYGADQQPNQNRLGWFGLGLKTASTSFCRQLTVVTRPRNQREVITATWDLEDVVNANEWVLEIGPADSDLENLFAEHVESALGVEEGASGTVVAWRKVDRLLRKPSGDEYVDPEGALKRRLEVLEWHLRMVFQRFLDTKDDRAVNVEIRLDGRLLKEWDPFAECFGVTPELKKKYAVSGSTGRPEIVLLRAFILPKPHDVEDSAKYKSYVRSHTSERQGFFFYRENRLIDTPGWIDKWGSETHLRGLRRELSVPAPLDPYFGVGLRKSGLQPDKSFIDLLDESVGNLRREANKLDRQGSSRAAVADAIGRPNPSDRIIGTRRTELTSPDVTTSEDRGTYISNNQPDDLVVLRPDGTPNPSFRIEVLTDADDVYVVPTTDLDGAGMWEPALRLKNGENDITVRVNTDHEWVRRAYLVHSQGSPERMSLDFLLYALSAAELNNTDESLRKEFEQFRSEVSRNLARLATELPEPSIDE